MNAKTREFLTKNTSDIVLINSLDKIFVDANVDNCIIFFKKNVPNWLEVAELKNDEVTTIGKVKSDFFGKNPIFSISMVKYKEAKSAFEKVDLFPKLDREGISSVKVGIQAYKKGTGFPKQTASDVENHIYHSDKQEDETYRKYLEGKDVSRYKLTWHGRWIKYGRNLSQPRYPELFENPRILVRQIPSNKTYAIEAVYVDEDVINDVNSATITDIQINPFYLLGVINSKLLTLWFMMKFDKFQRRIFPQFKANELGDFPIPDGNEEQQTLIAELVQKLMGEMKKEEKEESLISTLNTQIDESVMELFGLTEDEKQSVRDFEV